MEQPKGWNILKRIYDEAISYDSDYEFNYHSLTLSARHCVLFLDNDSEVARKVLREAEQACLLGLQRLPESGLVHHSLGRIVYELGDSERALSSFTTAVELDQKLGWAALFKAHCLHDLKRWEEALVAYRQVDLSFFKGHAYWHGVLVRDQIACCLYKAGDKEEAFSQFEECFAQYEKNPGLLFVARYLEEACEFFPDKFGKRAIALFEREQFNESAQAIRGMLN